TEVVAGYVAAGASGISVLTDEKFFGGTIENLAKARFAAKHTPILRKDFMLDEYQIIEAKAHGADVILLIAECLSADEIAKLSAKAHELGLEVLLEFHHGEELSKISKDVDIVGINNRDLSTFEVDVEASIQLASQLPADVLCISESGLSEVETVKYLRSKGFKGFLMGENFMKEEKPAEACERFISPLQLPQGGELEPDTPPLGEVGRGFQLKICGMREHDNIEAIKVLEPDFMGFIFYPESKRYVGDAPDLYLFALPSRIKKVAVFVNESSEKMLTICRRYRFDYVQIHGDESPEQCAELQAKGLKVIKAFAVDASFDFNATNAYLDSCEYFLFDTKCDSFGGSGKQFNWEMLNNYRTKKQFFLSGGIKLRDAAAIKALTHEQLFAVDINSGFEIEPGIKDNRLVAMFKSMMN
ncbi:MAG: bifunctional indole-3-glycerol phosphate synthase/phosphoribosylanthranilate isomerase, partial [Mangrovibacterium sp.]